MLMKQNVSNEFEVVKLEEYIMWKELGIIGGTAIIVLAALYFVIKWAVKSGMKEAYEEISGKEIKDDLDEILEKEAEGKERKNS